MRNVLASAILVMSLIAAVTAALLPVVLVILGSGDIGALSLDIQLFPVLLLAMLLINRMLRARRASQPVRDCDDSASTCGQPLPRSSCTAGGCSSVGRPRFLGTAAINCA